MANVISQSVLSGEVNTNKKTLSGELTTNQKILSGNFVERIVTNAKWGKISGDIENQTDLLELLENYKNVVTNVVEEPNGEDITIYWVDENGYEYNRTVPQSYVLDRIRYIYNNGLAQSIIWIFENKEWFSMPIPNSSINMQLPELVFWVNNGTIDGKLIKLLTAEGTGTAIDALKNYIFQHYTPTSDLPIAEAERETVQLRPSDPSYNYLNKDVSTNDFLGVTTTEDNNNQYTLLTKDWLDEQDEENVLYIPISGQSGTYTGLSIDVAYAADILKLCETRYTNVIFVLGLYPNGNNRYYLKEAFDGSRGTPTYTSRLILSNAYSTTSGDVIVDTIYLTADSDSLDSTHFTGYRTGPLSVANTTRTPETTTQVGNLTLDYGSFQYNTIVVPNDRSGTGIDVSDFNETKLNSTVAVISNEDPLTAQINLYKIKSGMAMPSPRTYSPNHIQNGVSAPLFYLGYATGMDQNNDEIIQMIPLTTVTAVINIVNQAIADAQVGAAKFQGTLSSQVTLESVDYKEGWYWVVDTAGTYAGQACQIGDFVFAISDKASAYSAADFSIVQANIDMSIFGNMAYADSATANFTPSGVVSFDFSNTSASVSPASTGEITYTPAGSVSLTNSNQSTTVSAANSGEATYTPAGSVTAPTISVSVAGSTDTIHNPTKETVAKTVVAAAPGQTAPDNSFTYYAVSGERLSLYQIGYTTGDSISISDVTVKTGDASYTATQPTFTGTGARLVTGDISVPSSASFTGTGVRLVTEDISVPTTAGFSGSPEIIVVTP